MRRNKQKILQKAYFCIVPHKGNAMPRVNGRRTKPALFQAHASQINQLTFPLDEMQFLKQFTPEIECRIETPIKSGYELQS